MTDVLIAVKQFPPDFSGAGLRAFKLASRMVKKFDYNYHVLCRQVGTVQEDENQSIQITRFSVSQKRLLYPFTVIMLFFKTFLYLNRKKEIEVIHFFSFGWLNRIIMGLNIFFFKKKTILEITQDADDDPLSLLKNGRKNLLVSPLTRFLLNRIDRYIAQSEFSRNSCIEFGIPESRIWLRPNPCDETQFGTIPFSQKKKLRKKLNLPDKFILLNVGLIQPRKNQLFLCKVMKKLDNQDIILLLVGPTKNKFLSYGKEIENYISKNKLKNIFLVGEKKNINEYMVASDLTVFPSLREGFPNVVIESLMSGLPVVSLDLEVIKKYLISKTGKVIVEEDENKKIEKFAEAVEKFHKKKTDRVFIRKFAIESFSARKIDKQYNQLYDKLIK